MTKVHTQFVWSVPDGDDPEKTEHLARSSVNRIMEALNGMGSDVSRHQDAAPKSAAHIQQLRGAVARLLLEGLEDWPS